MNILVIHALGDAISPPLLGKVVGPVNGRYHWETAFVLVAVVMALAGVLWLWGGAVPGGRHGGGAAPIGR